MREIEETTCNDIRHTRRNERSLKRDTFPRHERIPCFSYGVALKDRDEDDGAAPANREETAY